MSVWQNAPSGAALCGLEGELISVSVSVDPHQLETLLEVLAQVRFPINPQIRHGATTAVEFPAYAGDLDQVRQALDLGGFDPEAMRVTGMLAELHEQRS